MNADDGHAQAVEIDVTVNGVKASTTAGLDRPDLAFLGSPYHAFTYTLPTAESRRQFHFDRSHQPHHRCPYHPAQHHATTNPAPLGNVDLLNATTVAGWAYDLDATGPIQIRVDVDGVAGTPTATSLARPDVASAFHINGYNTVGFDVSGSYARPRG